VNTKGGKGNSKEADMVKENQVKTLKNLIGGLGSNKTDKCHRHNIKGCTND
jgi:hypothetical protein